MGLPRGRRWVDRPRKPAPNASMKWAEMRQVLEAPAEPINDPIAERDRVHRSADACARRQGELLLVAPPESDRDA